MGTGKRGGVVKYLRPFIVVLMTIAVIVGLFTDPVLVVGIAFIFLIGLLCHLTLELFGWW